jgi:hypothetical protein
MDTLKALLPIIPAMITAGKSAWTELVKPFLIGKGYKWTKEQEQEMLALEAKKDIKTIIEKLEGLNKELNQMAIVQTQTGNHNTQVSLNTGIIDNSTTYNIGVEENQSDLKKN